MKGVPGVEPPTSNLEEPFGSTQRGGFARSTIPARSSSSTSNRITKIRVRVSIAVEIVPQMTIPDALSTPKSGLRETLLLVCEGQTMQYMFGVPDSRIIPTFRPQLPLKLFFSEP